MIIEVHIKTNSWGNGHPTLNFWGYSGLGGFGIGVYPILVWEWGGALPLGSIK